MKNMIQEKGEIVQLNEYMKEIAGCDVSIEE
jgi:hypothetical protein